MNKTKFGLGIISLVVGIVFYLLDLDVYQDVIGGVNINIYATWFFVLLGGLLILWSFLRQPAS